MVCRFKPRAFLLLAACWLMGLSGCISYQYERTIYGVPIADPGDQYPLIQTTIGDVLSKMGAPDHVVALDGKDLLIYRRSLLQENSLSVGIPVVDLATGGSVDVSASGGLTRSDVLAFFFNSQGLLVDVVFEKGTDRPYLDTLLR